MKQLLSPSGRPIQRRTIFNNAARRREFYFYVGLIALPLIQFVLMYICVNLRSVLFVFQDYVNGEFVFGWSFAWQNLSEVFTTFVYAPALLTSWINSITYYVLNLAIITPLSVLTSFFIYKKLPLAGYFRIVLYLPNIVSGMATVLGYKYLVEMGVRALFPELESIVTYGSLLMDPKTAYGTLVFYSLWTALGGTLIMMTGVMSRTSVELLEASRMDGVNFLQELVHIVLPVVYPVLTISLYTGVVTIFAGGPPTYMFYGSEAPTETYTIQYYLFTRVVGSKAGDEYYPFAATSGLLLTLLVAPIVFVLKYLFEKYDPNEDNPQLEKRRRKKYGLA